MKGLPLLYGMSSVDRARLVEAGVKDLRALADLPNGDEIARQTDVEPERVQAWRHEARRELVARHARRYLTLGIAGAMALAVIVYMAGRALHKRPEDFHSAEIQANLDEQVARDLAALRADPADAKARAALDEILGHSLAAGRHLRGEKEWDEALHIYARALQIDPANGEARFYRGWILLQQKRYEDAIRTLRQSLPAPPEYSDWTYLNLGIAEASAGREAKAEETLKKASDGFVPALLQRTILARSNGRHDQAEALYRKVLEKEPQNEAAIYGLYDLTEAPRYRQDLEKLGGRYAVWLKAEDAIRAGDFRTATLSYESQLVQTPDDGQTIRLLGQAYVRWGVAKTDAAVARKGLARLEGIVSRGDAPPEAIFGLAWAYQVAPGAAKNLGAAKRYYKAYLDQVPNDHVAANNMAGILLATGDRDGFLAQARKNLEAMPHDADAHANVGYGLYLKGELAGAEAEYQAALAADKLSPVPPLLLGEVSLWRNSAKRAVTFFEQARQLMRKQGGDGAIWTLLLTEDKSGRLVYYDTVARKEAGLDLFQTMALLRDRRGAEAQQMARAALGRVGGAPEDVEIVRRALSDLARLEKEAPLGKDGKAVREVLEEWTKEKSAG